MKGLFLSLVVATFLLMGSANEVDAQCVSCHAPVRGAIKSVLQNTVAAWNKMRPVRRAVSAWDEARPVRHAIAAWDEARPVRRFVTAWDQRRPVRRFFGRCCQ